MDSVHGTFRRNSDKGYVDQGQAHYEEKYRQRIIKNLTKRAEALGLQLMPAPEGF